MKIFKILISIFFSLFIAFTTAAQCQQTPTNYADFTQCNRDISYTEKGNYHIAVPVSDWANGVYLLRMTTDNFVNVRKIIKQ